VIPAWTILAVALLYLGVLFAVAFWGDRRAEAGRSLIANPWVYSLSLAVYCTAWTFFGSVGRAASTGIGFLPIYLGPTLAAALSWVLLRRMVRISKQERITSIADFLASRYGKSRSLGAVVTAALVVGIVPYIALQLKAVSTTFLLLLRGVGSDVAHDPLFLRTSCGVAAVLAVFAILFGTRHLDLTEHHEGLVLAIAFESVVKLVAFLAIGIWVTFGLFAGPGALFDQVLARPELARLTVFSDSWSGWLWMLLLSFLAILFLPRQFQMAVIENVDEAHLRKSAWLFPLYMLAINLFVLPIAFAGRLSFAGGVDADNFVLALPLDDGQAGLALLVFVGGVSAATGMVIDETVALSTMMSNELLLPFLLRSALGGPDRDLGPRLLFGRRLSIVAVLGLGQLYLMATGAEGSLVSIGLISFSAVAQLAPAILGGLFWRGATKRGALAGIVGGFLVWTYTLPFPAWVESGRLPERLLAEGPFGLAWLRPQSLFGVTGLDPIAHSLFWSLAVNLGLLFAVSSRGGQTAVEYAQARHFVDVFRRRPETEELPRWRDDTPVAAVRSLLERFLGADRTQAALARYSAGRGIDLDRMVYADVGLVAFAERLLAGTTGAASARVALASVAHEQDLATRDVVRLLDESARVIATSRQLEEKSRALERATRELSAANERLRELDRLKDDFVATMAHELRTPLTSIRAFTEILHDHPDLDAAERGRFFDIVLRENERLTRLIGEVLDLAKLESGEAALRLEPVEPAALVGEAMASIGRLTEQRGIALEARIEPGLKPVEMDRDRVIQVLHNLLSNALGFCPDGGWIAVDARPSADGVELAVSDDGPGVPVGERETIFDKFRQAERPPARDRRGIGLGLSICREIVGRHGGRIWVEASERGGARFALNLPSPTRAETVSDQGAPARPARA
jgi:Na+/proline symporter/nitrogen-specific signal transduction histidine kinase